MRSRWIVAHQLVVLATQAVFSLSASALAHATARSYPRTGVTVYWDRKDADLRSGPASDPEIINTCMDPIKLEVDHAHFTAGGGSQNA